MKARMMILLGTLVLVLTACSQCPGGINTTDPSCPGYNPYYYQQQQQQQQPYGQYPNSGTPYPNGTNPGYPNTTYPQQQYPQGYPGQYQQPYNPYGPKYCPPGYICR